MGQNSSRHSHATPSTLPSPPEPRVNGNTRKPSRASRLLKRFKPSIHSRGSNPETPNANKSRHSWLSAKSPKRVSTVTALSSEPESTSNETASSLPSSPSILTPQTQSPATSHNNYGSMDKGPVVAVSAPSLEDSGESSGVDVLTPARNLSRRPSRLEPSEHTQRTPSETPTSLAIEQAEETPSASLSPQVSSASEEIRTPSPLSASPTSTNNQTLSPPQPTPPARQPFPPPGTLVLVQGVVQTTDVPRPPNADNSTETNAAPSARSTVDPGLPDARSTSRNTSSTALPMASETASVPTQAITHPEHEPALQTVPGEQTSTSTEGNSRSPPATPPNGVEVLGTLLSVAAAATAASLLAGSTEHILSPARPNSTAPSRNGEVPDLSLSARRERMRHAWQSVRERLGLRPTPPSIPPTDGQQVDAREVMLAEMARAFNLGLGIGPETDSSGAQTQTQVPTDPEPAHPPIPAPPGSFEHFLSDLQNDLRGVLNETEGRTSEVEQTHDSPTEASSTAPEPTIEEPETAESGSETAGENVSRNVNWWRMYRFPVMNTRNGVPTPVENATTGVAPIPTPNIPAPSPVETPGAPNVVPIVVVGLRSVNLLGQTPESAVGSPGSSPTEPEPMPGSWPTRAANTLGNVRPGRQGEQRPEAQGNGAPRTFLIFVIGGYYPPDHSMVTGGENSLASFEALLELAEMIGQAKPQTASKDDIERSGLQIIKANALAKYEKEGRISSNCTERCLICLDDYDSEDSVRIMSCRHGFHKTCVDRWLETGRNNCPACRSAGVSTETTAV